MDENQKLIGTGARSSAPARQVPDAETGLTLIEILVVLAIIAVMAYLIVPNVIGRPDQARATVASTDLRTISAALKMYRLDNGAYPTSQQGLAALAERPIAPPQPANWSPSGYLDQVPVDPWGQPYAYQADGSGFAITTLGADGTVGGEGPDADITVDSR
ncbi:type II secretion system major pseudopilin GspG [Altererythrobacter sp. SALINAS58]|nr:type II secretion system major pseudopilin GspG [Alteripontixanthobacter muriae]NTZ42456.1 type II secretion system major pseudopilin GspG [Alteripontixanthobacter muriae]